MPLPPRDYVGLEGGKAGILFAVEAGQQTVGESTPPTSTVYKFDLKTRKTEKAIDGVARFNVSHNGEKMLVRQGQTWSILAVATPPKPGDGVLKLDQMEVRVDPVAEWREMYREVWRGERDFFYDPQHHGLNLKAAEDTYEPYLASVASRGDLNYLFREMLGEMTVSHLRGSGGRSAQSETRKGRAAWRRLHRGKRPVPFCQGLQRRKLESAAARSLTQPGVNVVAGEYLLAVNGADLIPPRISIRHWKEQRASPC